MAIEIKRLFDIPQYQMKKYNLDCTFATKRNGEWMKTSTKEYIHQANTISRGLLRLGVQPNDKIAVISTTNRTEWSICDIGILQVGAQSVPIYPTISKEDYEYVLNHSEATYCIVSDSTIVEKLNQIKGKTKLKGVFTFDEVSGEKNWKEIIELGTDESNQDIVEQRKKNISADDLATLIYTSGTTGRPKGVMLSHSNLISNIIHSEKRVPLKKGDSIALSFLPLCHIFERTLVYLYQYLGISVYYAESIAKLSENAQEVKPNVMTAVPRLYEKIYDKIYAKGAELTGLKKRIFFWSLALGLKYEPYGANGWWYEKKLALARKLVFIKWQEALGGNLDIMVCASAALQTRLVRVFTAAGMPIMEGYGLTETSGAFSVNDKKNRGFKVGTVGRVYPEFEVKISDQDEILIKGTNVMMGYYKDPEKTATEFDDEGFFKTGDKGSIDKDNFLTITGRIKEIFKTSGGKYVMPVIMEGELKKSRFIEQVMVVGENEKMPTAFIQVNFEWIHEWAKRHNVEDVSNEEIVKHPKVMERIQEEVDLCNTKFSKWERIKLFTLAPQEWTIDGGQLTPTLKMKRKIIKEMYKKEYELMYGR